MKILQIINSLGIGGAEKLLLDTIPLYRKMGLEMDVLVLWNDNHPFLDALKELNCCKIYVLKESGNYKDIYNPLHILKIRKLLRQYDIAHVHLFPAQYFAVFANMGLNKKLVFTEHNTSNNRINNKLFKPLEKFIYNKYEKTVCISDEINEIYKHYLNIAERLLVINNGVDISKIRKADALEKNTLYPNLSDDGVLLLQVSAFREQKDQPTLIRAMKNLPDNFKLLLVGVGEQFQKCKDLVTELELETRVLFLGQRMDIPQLLKSADFVILSSNYEGLSLSSIEGLASGKPFIASDVPGLRDIVQGAGVLFELGNSKELAHIVQQLSEDKELYEQTVKKCISRANEYDITVMIDKHIKLYKEVYDQA